MERNLVEQDQRLSKDADINLTREFEEQKKKRAFEAQGSRKAEGSEDAELKQDQEKEVANLQRFLIPFACVEAKTGQLRSWRDPTFQMRLDVPGKEARRDVLLPIQILVGDLQQENDRSRRAAGARPRGAACAKRPHGRLRRLSAELENVGEASGKPPTF